jgi:hypothetical protein
MGLRLVSLAAAFATSIGYAINAYSWTAVSAASAWNRAQRVEAGPGIASGQTGISRGCRICDVLRFAPRAPQGLTTRAKGARPLSA